MAQIFVHTINDHFQIDDFVCTITELKSIIQIPKYDTKYFELQFNTNKLMANYLKYSSGNDVKLVGIGKTLQSFCNNFIKNKMEYIAKIEEKRTQKLLEEEQKRIELELSLQNQQENISLQ